MSDVSKFNVLGQIINVKDTIARNDIQEEKNDRISDIEQERNERLSDIEEIYKISNIDSDSRFLTVGKNGAKFTSINSALNFAKTLNPTNENGVTIFIYTGTYNEQIILNDVHGISFLGCGIDKTIIQYNGVYPDCTIHVQGDISFENLTVIGLNQSTYAIHSDALNTNVTGKISFEHCKIVGGSSAIGYGSNSDTELYVKDCILQANKWILYCHNSPYSGRNNQKLTILNNLFKHTTESLYLLLDDSGYSNGGVESRMVVVFSGNTFDYTEYGKMQFRKNTGTGEYITYLPYNDTNIICGIGNDNNSGMCGVNYHKGLIQIRQFFVFPTNPDTNGDYEISVPIDVYGFFYNRKLISVDIAGVVQPITDDCRISKVNESWLGVATKNSSVSGKSVSVAIDLTTQ